MLAPLLLPFRSGSRMAERELEDGKHPSCASSRARSSRRSVPRIARMRGWSKRWYRTAGEDSEHPMMEEMP